MNNKIMSVETNLRDIQARQTLFGSHIDIVLLALQCQIPEKVQTARYNESTISRDRVRRTNPCTHD